MENARSHTLNLLDLDLAKGLHLGFGVVGLAVGVVGLAVGVARIAVGIVGLAVEVVLDRPLDIAHNHNKTTGYTAQQISFDFGILDMCSFYHLI
ncbi:MAG: hypothetical protein V3U20_10930 [Thermoplasmata archaeon]